MLNEICSRLRTTRLLSVRVREVAALLFLVAPFVFAPASGGQTAPAVSNPRNGDSSIFAGGKHVSVAQPSLAGAVAVDLAPANAQEANEEALLSEPVMRPTRGSFLAKWRSVPGVAGYEVDVSTDRAFRSYTKVVTDRVTFRVIGGLEPNTTYYYRVRGFGARDYSTSMSVTTADNAGLTIDATFDASITSNPISAAIQSAIIKAIAVYQTLFSDPITVHILFRFAPTDPSGAPLPEGIVSRSDWVFYMEPWSSVIAEIKADSKSVNDSTAVFNLPPTSLSADLLPTSANGRALGLDTPTAMFSDGHVGVGGFYDGIVTLNSNRSLRFYRPAVAGSYDAITAIEHEIDEVMGLGSHLNLPPPFSANLRPEDLFTWTAPHKRNTTSVGSRYLSIDPGVTKLVELNQISPEDFGDWQSGSCPNPYPLVQDASGCPGQIADVTVSSPEAVSLDIIGYDLDTSNLAPTALGNISTRLKVGSGDDVLIGGFIVDGSKPTQVLLRALGPSLGLPGALLDPTLELHSATALLVSNDNWQTGQKAEIVATGIPPTNAKESAIVATLDPGSYTAIVRGATGGSGLALVEVYDLDQTGDSDLANISTRGLVGTGDDVLIGGFIILGGDSGKVLIRALGPSLPLSGTLADPTLELHNGDGMVIAYDDDWRTDQLYAITGTGLPPPNDAEAAIVSTLPPGSYTAIVRGADDTTGLALVEVYHLAK